MSTPIYKGQCCCGNFKFEAFAEPLFRPMCHCTVCQRTVGAPSYAGVAFTASVVKFVNPDNEFSFKNGDSAPASRFHCKKCGAYSHVESTIPGAGPIRIISLTLFERDEKGKIKNLEKLKPTMHIFYNDRQLNVIDNLTKWSTFPGAGVPLFCDANGEPQKRIIAVIGATGMQGGAVIRAIQADKSNEFVARAVCRTVDSDKAKLLKSAGVEVVQGDVNDLQSLVKAFTGCYGAFLVTPFWETMNAETELVQATNLALACKQANVKHCVWSTLEDSRRLIPLSDNRLPTLQGRYKVPHFDAKGFADNVFIEMGLPVTLYRTSFYFEDLIMFGMAPKKLKPTDDFFSFVLPMSTAKLPAVAVEDIGIGAYSVFKSGMTYIGKTVSIAGSHQTGAEMAASMTKVLKQDVRYVDVPASVYAAFGFPGADDLANMFAFKVHCEKEYCAARDLKVAKMLSPKLQSFDDWLELNKAKLILK